MRRQVALLLFICMLVSMTGCLHNTPPVTTSGTVHTTLPSQITVPVETTVPVPAAPFESFLDETTPPETVPPETAPALTVPIEPDPSETVPGETFPELSWQLPMATLSAPLMAEEAGFLYPSITLVHPDYTVSSSVVADLRRSVELYRGTEGTVACTPMRVDQSIVSVVLTCDENMTCRTYDMVTGKELTLSQLFAEDASTDTLVAMLCDVLSENKALYSWYTDTISDLFVGNSMPSNWYLSGNGFCVSFMPYEIAPASAGIVTAEIPYEALGGIIRDRYYPAETPEPMGGIQICPFADAPISQFSEFAEVLMSNTNNVYLIYPDYLVTQLRIEQISYSEDSAGYVVTNTVFAADVLAANQAIFVQYDFPTDTIALQIRYISAGKTHTRYIQVHEDGRIFLPKA